MNHLSFAFLLVSVAASSVTAQETPRKAARCRASHLVGCPITGSTGQNLGEIRGIVLDVGNHRIAYVVVAPGGSLHMEDKYFMVPWRLLEVRLRSAHDRLQATLSLEPATLKAAPRFDKSKWPDMTSATWSQPVDEYYSSRNENLPHEVLTKLEDSKVSDAHNPVVHCLLNKLFGTAVVNKQSKALATAEDLVVDTQSAAVAGVLLSFGGDLGRGEKFALVPSEALSFNKERVFVFSCSPAGLKAMTLKGGKWPALDNDSWLTRGRKLCAKASENVRVANRGVIRGKASEATSLPFADSYDLARVETIKGSIMTVGLVLAGDNKEERVRLRIRVAKGREVIVYAAPAAFEHQQALGLRAGTSVEVVGSPARHHTQTVLVGGSIVANRKTATLRDEHGHPIWTKTEK